MASHRFFLEEQRIADEVQENFILALSAADKHHARVLRLDLGERIAIVDAAQDYFICEITSFDGDDLRVRVARKEEGERLRPRVVVVQGLTKNEKMEMVIRHATELGVDAFIPYRAARSVVKLEGAEKVARKIQRWQAIAKSAAIQSGQDRIPAVYPPHTLEQLMPVMSEATAAAVCWEEAYGRGVSSFVHDYILSQEIAFSDMTVFIVIGPEGGFESNEVEAMCGVHDKAAAITLGSSILRTETAGVVAPALLLHELGAL